MTIEQVHYLNVVLGVGAIILQIISAVVLLALIFTKKGTTNKLLDMVSTHFVLIGFLLALSATFFSYIYSDVVGFLPCHLCWYARVFMFPQVFIWGAALYYKDRMVTRYIWPVLVAGLLVSIYHNYMYYFSENSSSLPCDASGISCYQRLISEFGGYISIPMLSLTSIVAIMTLLLVVKFYKKDHDYQPKKK